MSFSRNSSSGITLLLALVVMTVSLTVAMGIFSIIYGEFKISGDQPGSAEAFFAVDAGVECFEYWWSRGAFSNDTASGDFTCGVPPISRTQGENPEPMNFAVDSRSCVTLKIGTVRGGTTIVTTVIASGKYPGTLSDGVCVGGARTVERGVTIRKKGPIVFPVRL